jgi:uncharacterized SAM-binding protein YcdF (DUF218 family)
VAVRRLLVVLAVLVAAWIGLSLVLFVFPSAETGAPPHADAVVVLSGDSARLPAAERLIRARVAPVLMISSIAKTPRWRAAIRLCRAGRYDGARVLCFEANPYSTRGEAETVSRIARRRGWRSLAVVSSTFHLTRASLLFRRCYAGTLSFVGAPIAWWREPVEWAEETVKLLVQTTVERSC